MTDSRPDRLRDLLACYDAAGLRAASERLSAQLSAAAPLLIFGAGQNGRLVLDVLRKAGLEPAAFVDDTPAKIGSRIDGVPVIVRDDAPVGATCVVSIFTPAHGYGPVAADLSRRGLQPVGLLAVLRAVGPERLPFYFLADGTEVLEAGDDLAWLAERLTDEASFDLLCAQLEFRLNLRPETLPPWSAGREPPPSAWPSFSVIDAGAFDGDTLAPLFAGHGSRIEAALALEPDPQTSVALRRNLEADPCTAGRVRILQAAVDADCGRRAFCNLGHAGSSFGEGGAVVDTVSLDALAANELAASERLYIKLDVEGAEAAAIAGAANVIATRRPFLAVSVYHRPDDLWSLARQIGALAGDAYRYRLRSHGADGADLVLYAVPPS